MILIGKILEIGSKVLIYDPSARYTIAMYHDLVKIYGKDAVVYFTGAEGDKNGAQKAINTGVAKICCISLGVAVGIDLTGADYVIFVG